ncbi:hypothetical protein ABDF71_24875 [Ochrobactrum sp. WV_118_8]
MKLEITISDEQAWAFPEFLKRLLPEDFERCAADQREPNLMWDAGLEIQRSLTDKGFALR